MTPPDLVCCDCGKRPAELEEYVSLAEQDDSTPELWCWENEGTINRTAGTFCCTQCYVLRGCPSRPWPDVWVAPPGTPPTPAEGN